MGTAQTAIAYILLCARHAFGLGRVAEFQTVPIFFESLLLEYGGMDVVVSL